MRPGLVLICVLCVSSLLLVACGGAQTAAIRPAPAPSPSPGQDPQTWTPPPPVIVEKGDTGFDTSCTTDGDCAFVNTAYGYGCCYAGYCDAVDYSQDSWTAVNGDWLENKQAETCPEDCGPSPMCPQQSPVSAYEPFCDAGVCKKRAIA